jgi:putative membrane protein
METREPDARFTLANERTLLAWVRTALALLVAGLGALQLLPVSIHGLDRRVIAFPLLAAAAAIGLGAYPQWRRGDRALRAGRPVPGSPIPGLAAIVVGLVALAAAVVGLFR